MKVLKFIGVAGLLLAMASCGGNKQAAEDTTATAAAEETTSAVQPLVSGVYDAVYFDIKGETPRKGPFDGRVIYSMNPDQTAILVYENGNRTKIKHVIMLSAPFAQSDSTYTSTDAKGNPVVLGKDSTSYYLNYVAKSDTVTITHNQPPRNTYSDMEALQKISEEANK